MKSQYREPTGKMITHDELDDLRTLYHEYHESVKLQESKFRLLNMMREMIRQKYDINPDLEFIDTRSGEIVKHLRSDLNDDNH